jgi:hypothetical protein
MAAVRGIVFVDDRSAVHIIPRAEVRYVEVVALGGDGWALKYQLAGTLVVRSVEWKGESRPETLKTKVEVGEYNNMAAGYLLTVITRGHRDVHLERRSDNVFFVRSGLVEDDARAVLCRQFIVEMALTARQTAVGDEARLQMLHEIHAAARDLVLPDWFPLKEDRP